MKTQTSAPQQLTAYFGFLSEPFTKDIAAKSLFTPLDNQIWRLAFFE